MFRLNIVGVELHNRSSVSLGKFTTLIAELLAHFLVELGAVNQLHLTLACFRLVIIDNPNVGGNTGVIEHVSRKRDNGIHQIAFEQPLADIRRPGICCSVEKR